MNLPHAANGFVFLAFVLGAGSFFGMVGTCVAFSERERYAWPLAIVTGIAILSFLTCGFMGAALR